MATRTHLHDFILSLQFPAQTLQFTFGQQGSVILSLKDVPFFLGLWAGAGCGGGGGGGGGGGNIVTRPAYKYLYSIHYKSLQVGL